MRVPRPTPPAVLAVLLLAASSVPGAQGVVLEVPWTGVGQSFSTTELNGYEDALAAIGDIDGDGITELAQGSADEGVVRIFSGATGALVDLIDDSVSSSFGQRVLAAGDVDGDGVPDLYVGVTGELVGEIRSGATGDLIHRIEASSSTVVVNELEFAPLEDIDGDGRAEFATGVIHWKTLYVGGVVKTFVSLETPVLRVHDGASANVLTEITGGVGERFGHELVVLGDIDGDGVRDLGCSTESSVWSAFGSVSGQLLWSSTVVSGSDARRVDDVDGDGLDDVVFGTYGFLWMLSGGTGVEVWCLTGAGGLGASLIGCDWNGDGVGDVMVGATDVPLSIFGTYACPTCTGRVEVLDGADGTTLAVFQGQPGDAYFGAGVAPLGDVNGDGSPDLAAAYLRVGPWDSFTRIVSGAPLALTADRHLLSLSAGGIYGLRLDFGAAHAGELALIVATTSGTSPGVDLGPVHVPIEPDAFTYHVLDVVPPVALDGAGVGAIDLVAQGGQDPVLMGLTLHYAAVSFDAAGSATSASAALPLTLID